MEALKSKDREMRYKHMMKKLEAQRKERIHQKAGFITKAGESPEFV